MSLFRCPACGYETEAIAIEAWCPGPNGKDGRGAHEKLVKMLREPASIS